MIELTTIEGLIKYAKELIDNIKGRQIVTAKNTKIYRIDGGTKVLTRPANSMTSFAISFFPSSGKASHAELLVDFEITTTSTTWQRADIQLTPFQSVDRVDWLVRVWNGNSSSDTKTIGIAVNALEQGSVVIQ